MRVLCTSEVPRAFGSLMKAWPPRQFGGSSPVVTCLRHSMVVWERGKGEAMSGVRRGDGREARERGRREVRACAPVGGERRGSRQPARGGGAYRLAGAVLSDDPANASSSSRQRRRGQHF